MMRSAQLEWRAFAPCIVVLASACAASPPSAHQPAPGPLRAAAVVRPIQLPVGHSHAGYFQSRALGDRHPADDPGSPFADTFPATRGVQSLPSARIIVLENGDSDLVLVRLDLAYTTEEITAHVIARARARLGRDLAGRLLLNSTHTHGAGHRASRASTVPAGLTQFPEQERHAWALGGDSFNPESLHRIVEPIVDGIEEAYATLRPARFGYGFGENATAAGDRRCESDWLEGADQSDKRVTVMRIDDDETNAPIAIVVGYAMHGIVYDRDSRHLTVDAPGHVEYAVEAAMPAPVVAFYLQGNVGDASPRGSSRGHQASQAMMRAGWDLAQTALEVWRQIGTERNVVLNSIDRAIALGHEELGYDVNEFYVGGALLCSTGMEGCQAGAAAAPEDVFCVGQAELEGAKTRTWLSILRIGSLHVLGVPGEPVGTYGRSLIQAVEAVVPPGSSAVVAGLSMDHNGYLMEELDWLSGGYEPTISPWGWRMGPFLREQLVDLARTLTTGEARLGSVPRPELSMGDWAPVVPSGSMLPPGEVTAPTATVPRLQTAVWEFTGGDPTVDQPEVTVERQEISSGEWRPVLDGAWKPVSSMTGPRLPLFYVATPTFAEDPVAAVRDHRWTVKWEPPRDAHTGPHRFVSRGRTASAMTTTPYRVTSTPFSVVANEALIVEARVVGGAQRNLAVTLRYPARAPESSRLEGSEDWQVDGFGFVDPWFAPPFVPVWTLPEPVPAATAQAMVDGVEVTIAFAFHGGTTGTMLPKRYEPGDGPGFAAPLPTRATTVAVELAPGVLRDVWGNGNAGVQLNLTAGAEVP